MKHVQGSNLSLDTRSIKELDFGVEEGT